jgi:phosphopantothenoylcysteine decarboxylase/phosphopantothenate--cysteine ligase
VELADQRILVGICGGIAAYKACQLISHLFQVGAEVRAVMTQAAEQFITPLTVTTLCRHPVALDEHFWQPTHTQPLHIQLGEWAGAIVIAPLSANTLAKLNYGLADNLLLNVVLASRCPILLAPAMNTDMWEQANVQRNWQELLQNPRFTPVMPGTGRLACDRIGPGRMAEPEQIYLQLLGLLHRGRDWQGRCVLVSAGTTREYWDAARFLGNPATGRMGLALATAAQSRGARVTLIAGNVDAFLLNQLPPMQVIPVTTAEEMQQATLAHFQSAEVTIMAAAVADLKPAQTNLGKLPKQDLPASLPLLPVPDILAQLGQIKQPHQKLIGFAAQTGDIVAPAQEKLQRKNLDAIVANPIDQVDSGFASDTNQAIFINQKGEQIPIPLNSKLQLAHHLLDLIKTL